MTQIRPTKRIFVTAEPINGSSPRQGVLVAQSVYECVVLGETGRTYICKPDWKEIPGHTLFGKPQQFAENRGVDTSPPEVHEKKRLFGIPMNKWIEVPDDQKARYGRYCKFRVYKTSTSYAVQIFTGHGKLSNFNRPTSWHRNEPEYRKSEKGLKDLIKRKLKARGLFKEEKENNE